MHQKSMGAASHGARLELRSGWFRRGVCRAGRVRIAATRLDCLRAVP
jgi:hypothetical protein